jgi:putative flippase GtrA
LIHAGTRAGLYELPVLRWRDVGESKVKTRDFVRAISEMAEIYRAYFLRRRHERWLDLLSAPLLRYVGAGGIGTVFHYLLLMFLVEFYAVRPSRAAIAGSILGAVINYTLNYHLTFAAKTSHLVTLPKFAGVALLSALLNGAGMWLFAHTLHVHYLVAQVLCTISVLIFGYLLNRTWTFAGSELEPDDAEAIEGIEETEGAAEPVSEFPPARRRSAS